MIGHMKQQTDTQRLQLYILRMMMMRITLPRWRPRPPPPSQPPPASQPPVGVKIKHYFRQKNFLHNF